MRTERASDSAFRTLLFFGGIAVSILLIAILLSLLLSSRPALVANGFRFLTGTEWDPVTNSFHALPFVFGTLVTSLIALVIATILSLALAILMGEYFRAGAFASIMRTAVELLAGIPSIVYGFIGLFFLVPAVRVVQIAAWRAPVRGRDPHLVHPPGVHDPSVFGVDRAGDAQARARRTSRRRPFPWAPRGRRRSGRSPFRTPGRECWAVSFFPWAGRSGRPWRSPWSSATPTPSR